MHIYDNRLKFVYARKGRLCTYDSSVSASFRLGVSPTRFKEFRMSMRQPETLARARGGNLPLTILQKAQVARDLRYFLLSAMRSIDVFVLLPCLAVAMVTVLLSIELPVIPDITATRKY